MKGKNFVLKSNCIVMILFHVVMLHLLRLHVSTRVLYASHDRFTLGNFSCECDEDFDVEELRKEAIEEKGSTCLLTYYTDSICCRKKGHFKNLEE